MHLAMELATVFSQDKKKFYRIAEGLFGVSFQTYHLVGEGDDGYEFKSEPVEKVKIFKTYEDALNVLKKELLDSLS